jgi:hypothetical protein
MEERGKRLNKTDIREGLNMVGGEGRRRRESKAAFQSAAERLDYPKLGVNQTVPNAPDRATLSVLMIYAI